MVDIEEVPPDNDNDDDDAVVIEEVSVSEERRLDAEAIEQAASQMTRPSAKLQLESLAKKLRKESEALARMERSKAQQSQATSVSETPLAAAAEESTAQPSTTTQPEPAAAPIPVTPSAPPVVASSAHYTPIDKFAFDSGSYEAPFVTLYVDLPDVGSIPKDQVTCQFTKGSFDFIVKDLNGKTYRLFKDNLEKEIDPDKSKLVIKAQKVLIKLHKVKQGEYGSGYEYWSQLTDKKKAKKNANKKDNPQASIMELMKEMYDDGDDNMKKIIGETMMKQQRGEMGGGGGGADGMMGGMGMGGGLDDF